MLELVATEADASLARSDSMLLSGTAGLEDGEGLASTAEARNIDATR